MVFRYSVTVNYRNWSSSDNKYLKLKPFDHDDALLFTKNADTCFINILITLGVLLENF